MALPTSRDATFAPGSQVPSSVLNDIQDQIIANNTRLNTARVRPVSAAAASGQQGGGGSWQRGGGAGGISEATTGPFFVLANANDTSEVSLPLPVEAGDTITAWSVDWQNDSSDRTISANLFRSNGAGKSSVGNMSAALGTGRTTPSASVSHGVVSGEAYWIGITPGGNSVDTFAFRVYKVSITVVRA